MKKILFIEDDADMVVLYRDALKGKDVHVIEARTGKEGLTKVDLEQPDLIILDIMLPGGMNGFDVLEQLKVNPDTKGIPVIVLTNLDSEEEVAKKIGAVDYRIKSNTSLGDIVELIEKHIH